MADAHDPDDVVAERPGRAVHRPLGEAQGVGPLLRAQAALAGPLAEQGLGEGTVALGEVADIGLRMLQPRELARAQGFGDDYVLTGSKANQIARIGNSVCPPVAEAIVRANVVDAGQTARRRALRG